MNMKKILLVEDDTAFRETLVTALEEEGFAVVSSGDGRDGLGLAQKEKVDLIALDIVLPSLGGLEVCRELREKKVMTPIIMLSGKRKEEIDKVLGLELGADDYIIKPFGPREFLARVKAILRRGRPEPAAPEEVAFGDVSINFKTQTALKGNTPLRLTAKEFGLLRLLVSHAGEVINRNVILNEVWGYEKYPTTRTVDTFIHNLRKKIEDDPAHPRYLLTVPWSGYRFQP
jgi:DNA-binding response OmpR family regulator